MRLPPLADLRRGVTVTSTSPLGAAASICSAEWIAQVHRSCAGRGVVATKLAGRDVGDDARRRRG
jgi:hypothetical protein